MSDTQVQLPQGYNNYKPVEDTDGEPEKVTLPQGYDTYKPVEDQVSLPTGYEHYAPAGSVPHDERYYLTRPEAGQLPEAAKSSYEVRPVLPSGERAGSMQTRPDEAQGTVGEQQAVATRQAEHPLLTNVAGGGFARKGATLGREVGRNIIPYTINAADQLANDVDPESKKYTPINTEQFAKEHPTATGVAEGAGEFAGGTVADPTNWALALSGGAEVPVLSKLMSAVFAAKMGKDTIEGAKQLGADWDNLTPEERYSRITQLGLSTLFSGAAGAHATGDVVRSTPDLIDTARVPAAKYIGIPLERATTPKNLISIPTASAAGTLAHVIPVPGAPEAAGIGTYGVAGRIVESILGKEKANTPLWNAPESIIAPETRSEIALQGDLKNAQQFLNKITRDAQIKYTNIDRPIPSSVQRIIDAAQADVDIKQRVYEDAKGKNRGRITSNREGTERQYEQQRQAREPMSEEEEAHAAARHAAGYPLISFPDVPAEDITAKHPGIRPVAGPEDTTGKGFSNSGTSPPTEPLIPPSAKPGARYRGMEKIAEAPVTTSVETTGKGFSKSGTSPPAAELIPSQPSVVHPASEELIPTKSPEKTTGIPEREPGLMTAGEEGREPAKSAEEYHPAVQQKVNELSDENLKKLAQKHGLNPDEYDFNARDARRHRVERDQLVKDITDTIGDDEKINIGRAVERLEEEGTFQGKDLTAKARAERAAKLFPRLRGPVDESGNPISLEGMSPRELHQNLGFGERNVGVTKEEFEAAKKSFNDKSTRSNAGLDPTMLVDAAKVAAYYLEGGVREFSAFSKQMVLKLGEAIRPHLEELYARAKANVAPTWKGTAEEWKAARADVDARAARSKSLPEGPRLPEAMGGPALSEEQPFRGNLTASKLERYTDPNGQFYKTVLKELQKSTTPEAARDLAQDVMADFTANVKEGKFTLPEHISEEGRVTNALKSIAHNKAADWVDEVSGQTASGKPRNVVETKRLSETATTKKGSTGPKLGEQVGVDEEISPNRPEESKSPYGFGEEPSYRDEHSNAQYALNEYLKAHPETAAEDKELLLSASKRSLEKAEAARSKAYDAELAKSGDVEKAIEAGRKAEARVNSNKFTATERYFGLTDADLTKLGQAQHLTGPKFRARLTAIMDDLNSRAEKGVSEHPRTGPAAYEGQSGYTRFLSDEGPARTGFGRITTEEAPTVAKPTETYGNAEGFIKSQPKTDLIPSLEHAPSRIGGFSKDTEAGNAGGANEPIGSRALAGPKVAHREAWSLPPSDSLGGGQTLPLTEPLPIEKPAPLIPETTTGRGGRTGITPIDVESAAADRERLANLRVSEAEQALSEAKTPAEQRRARVQLEDAKDRQNLIKALKKPASGGSQGADVNAIASDYLKTLQRGGATIPKIEAVIPEAGNIIHGVEEEAQRFGVNLRNRGFEQPTEVEHAGKAASSLPRIAIGHPSEHANLIPEATSPEINTGANRFLANKEKAERGPTKEEQNIAALAKVRERLGLRHSGSRVAQPETLGTQTPLIKAPERLANRATAQYSFRETPRELTTSHSVEVTSPQGRSLGKVAAVSENSDPNTWVVRISDSEKPGTGLGTEAYAKLLDQAQAESNRTGRLVTVKGDSVQSDSAKAVWKKLGQYGYDVQHDKAKVPFVTFSPTTAEIPYTSNLPHVFGGAEPSASEPFLSRILKQQ